MPLSEKQVLELKCVGTPGAPVDQVVLKWPSAPDGAFFLGVPLRVCKTGMILALPRKAFSEEELEEAKNNPEEELLGPSQVVTTSIEGSTDFEAELAVVLVEFNMSVRSQLAKRTRKMTKAVIGFAEDLDSLPDLKELEEICATWLESGLVRNENFVTANEDGLPLEEGSVAHEISKFRELMEERMALLEAQVISVKSQQQHAGPAPNAGRGASPKTQARSAGPSSTLGGGYGRDVQARGRAMMEVLDGAQPQAHIPRPPTRMPDEPHKATMSAATVGEIPSADGEDMSVDQMFKMTMMKMMQDVMGKKSKKKNRRLPGLPATEASESSGEEEGEGWSSSSRGGKGIEAVEKLKLAMKAHPEAYQERMEQRMMKAIEASEMDPSVPHRYARSMPVGKSRTAGYCVWGLAEVHKLLLENKPRQARLQVIKMQAAMEQFLIDESWVVGSRLLGTEEPPWGHWATQDLQALRKQYIYTRLVEATWVASLINQLKEEDWLVKKRNSFKQAPNKKGDGKGSGETARE